MGNTEVTVRLVERSEETLGSGHGRDPGVYLSTYLAIQNRLWYADGRGGA